MRCRIYVVISVSVMTCHWALVLVRKRSLEFKLKHQCAFQLQVITMGLDKYSRALLVKPFHQNNSNSAAALREYQRIKGIQRDPLSVPGVKNIIRRFELTGDLGIAPGEADGQLRQKLLKKLLLPWLRILDIMCDLH